MADSLEQASRWAQEARGVKARTAQAVWWGGPAVGRAPELAGRLPGGGLAGGIQEGVAAIDRALVHRR